MQTTTPINNIIVQQLAKTYRECRNQARNVRKAASVLGCVEIEVEWKAVDEAAQRFDDAAEHFRRELEKMGYEEHRFGQFSLNGTVTA